MAPAQETLPPTGPVYKVYKRRFFGLAQLVLLNIVVSWDVSISAHRYLGRSLTSLSSG